MKQDNIVVSGIVSEELGNSMFRVQLDSGHSIICTISGKIRKNFIRILAGDNVVLEMSPYDLTRGRITRRVDNNMSVNSSSTNKKKKK